ncbi:hypothetical protein SBRCBS47491_003509 [Sporothrix bragantina]|uniref:Dimethylaniline monooxygenase 2 n=1 Tax=Sporothrix bragantina TaxID=671064 RepID=A0ABP0BFV4_9PEZI
MLKTLLEYGFRATAFEKRHRVGGLWSYTDDTTLTSALPSTSANISKFTCGYSDYPMPDKYPVYLRQSDFQEFAEDYAKHFNLYDHIVFDSDVTQVNRTTDDSKWRVDMVRAGQQESREFDKVVFCHGYQSVPRMPDFEDRDKFEGEIMHVQKFRDPETLKGKKVLIVGFGVTACQLGPLITPYASKVYLSHRRGAYLIKRTLNGRPADLLVNYSRRRLSYLLQQYFPGLALKLSDLGLRHIMKQYGKLEPEWRIPADAVPIQLSLAQAFDDILPCLRDGSVTSLPGVKRFTGGKSVEFADGTVVEDVDVVICCTGYRADFSLTPFVETSRPAADDAGHPYGGAPIVRLYKNIFPPAYADSVAILTYSAYGKNNGFSFADVTSMAISNIWRGVSADLIPPRAEMDRQIDADQRWVAGRWHRHHDTDVSAVKQWEFQGFLHAAAGTGMENLGWGWKGWLFFFRDPRMSWLMNHGVETAHAFRYFETGKRKTWPGARDEIIRVNELVKHFPPDFDKRE